MSVQSKTLPSDTLWNPQRGEVHLADPLKWQKSCRVVLSNDLFCAGTPFDFIDRVFAVMALCPQHVFQILTKRPERMAEYLNCKSEEDDWSTEFRVKQTIESWACGDADWLNQLPVWDEYVGLLPAQHLIDKMPWPLPNVWLGTSVEDQRTADARIPHLLSCPAAVRFLSCEPLLGAVDLGFGYGMDASGDSDVGCVPCDVGGQRHQHPLAEQCHRNIHWLIIGGESGPKARPCNLGWIRDLKDQCRAAGVPCFVKQLGADCVGDDRFPAMPDGHRFDPKGGDPSEWPEDLRVRQMPREGGKS